MIQEVPPIDARVAQLVEQRTENPRVGGSNPPLGTTKTPGKLWFPGVFISLEKLHT